MNFTRHNNQRANQKAGKYLAMLGKAAALLLLISSSTSCGTSSTRNTPPKDAATNQAVESTNKPGPYKLKEEYWFDPNSSVYDPDYKNATLKEKCEIIAGRWESNKADYDADQNDLWKESGNNNSEDLVGLGCEKLGIKKPKVDEVPIGDYQAYLNSVTKVRKELTRKVMNRLEQKGITWSTENDPTRLSAISEIEALLKPRIYDSAPKTLSREQVDSIWQEVKSQVEGNL